MSSRTGRGCRRLRRRAVDELLPGEHPARLRRRGQLRACGTRLRHRQAQREAGAPRHRLGDVDAHDALELQVGREPVDRVVDLVPHDREARLVVFELVAQLARGVERVVLDDDRPEPQHRVERDHVLRAVRQHDRDPVAVRRRRGGAGPRPRARSARRGRGRTSSRRRTRARSPSAVAGDARLDHVGERLRDLVDRLGHPGRVRRQPRPGSVRVLRVHHASLTHAPQVRLAWSRDRSDRPHVHVRLGRAARPPRLVHPRPARLVRG